MPNRKPVALAAHGQGSQQQEMAQSLHETPGPQVRGAWTLDPCETSPVKARMNIFLTPPSRTTLQEASFFLGTQRSMGQASNVSNFLGLLEGLVSLSAITEYWQHPACPNKGASCPSNSDVRYIRVERALHPEAQNNRIYKGKNHKNGWGNSWLLGLAWGIQSYWVQLT